MIMRKTRWFCPPPKKKIPPIDWLPFEKWVQTHVPGYYVSNKARVYSYRSGRLLCPWQVKGRGRFYVGLDRTIYPLSYVVWRGFHPREEDDPVAWVYRDGARENSQLENIEGVLPGQKTPVEQEVLVEDEAIDIEEELALLEAGQEHVEEPVLVWHRENVGRKTNYMRRLVNDKLSR